MIQAFKSSAQWTNQAPKHTPDSIKASVSRLLGVIKSINPLVHQVIITKSGIFRYVNMLQITNTVVTNQSANATLALGASPIMTTAPEEMEDLSRVIGALLVNFGTVKDKEGMLLAGQC
jgi:thiamine-phosphate diphosphorylase/hydroxyethylthiazole kinase